MPSWVSNEAKYNRAVKSLKDQNVQLVAQGKPTVEVTEEAVKALYVKYAGLVLGGTEEENVAIEDLGIRDLRKIAKAKGIETEGLEREDLIAAISAA